MIFTRRDFFGGLLLPMAAPLQSRPAGQASIGAIRWDAWYEKTGESKAPQNNLSPPEYQDRAPVHCTIANGDLSCVGSQSVIDNEIRTAHDAGLSFWAFDWYPESSSLHRAWSLYQSSSVNHLIDWCPIMGLGSLGSASSSQDEVDAHIDFFLRQMASSTYFRVAIDGQRRPVIFLFYRENELTKYFKTLDGLRAALATMRQRAADAGVGEPYVVLFDPALDVALFKASGADAISNYISDFHKETRGPFVDLDAQARKYWQRMASSGAPMMPIAQVGWDTRPRIAHPVPWEHETGQSIDRYFALATPAQFERHIRAAIDFVDSHAQSCPARTILVYSWDECDEGGCIMPTLGDPQGRYLAALRSALR
jgi:hypothetical protein